MRFKIFFSGEPICNFKMEDILKDTENNGRFGGQSSPMEDILQIGGLLTLMLDTSFLGRSRSCFILFLRISHNENVKYTALYSNKSYLITIWSEYKSKVIIINLSSAHNLLGQPYQLLLCSISTGYCALSGAALVERDYKLGTKGRAEIDANLLEDVLGYPQVGQVQLASLRRMV